MPRAPKKPIIYNEKINLPKKIIRFSTPKEAALHRAERLKCSRLAEIGSGVAAQTIAFSLRCGKVLGIEINPLSLKIARDNIKKAEAKNIELIEGDALDEDLIKKVEEFMPEIIFCDTQRPERSKRTLSDIKPNIFALIEKYSKITDKIAIEIPPYTNDIEKLSYKFPLEKEFISIDGKLNRLTLYFGSLKTCEISVIEAKTEEKISGSPKKVDENKMILSEIPRTGKYLGVINPAISISGMTANLCEKMDSKLISLEDKEYLISDKIQKTAFAEYYKILSSSDKNKKNISKKLIELKAKHAVIRYKISPEDYWKERKELEKGLEGLKTVHLFKCKDKIVFCEKADKV